MTGRAREMKDPREIIAWLLWCVSEGYVNAEDRAILANWLGDDAATLHPDDVAMRDDLLGMADEFLAALAEGGWTICTAEWEVDDTLRIMPIYVPVYRGAVQP